MKKIIPMTLVLLLLTWSIWGIRSVPQSQPTEKIPLTSSPIAFHFWNPSLPPINAIALAMVERDLSYAPNDPDFLWSCLFYMIGLYGHEDWRVIEQAQQLFVPEEVVHDYRSALFQTSPSLPTLPSSMVGFIQYSPYSSAYLWTKGDCALVDTRITVITPLGGGRHQIEGELFALEDGAILWDFVGVLEENNSLFGYSIENFSVASFQSENQL